MTIGAGAEQAHIGHRARNAGGEGQTIEAHAAASLLFYVDIAEPMVAFTRFFERVDRHCGVFARIDFGDLGGEIAARAVGVFAHQHVDARSGLGHDEQTAVR